MQVSEGWRAVASEDGQRVTLRGKEGGAAVEYGRLVVWDANGSPVKAALLVEDERVIIEVDDASATYPLTIDPTFALQQHLTAADGAANDNFGVSVAISGDTVVVGAYLDDVAFTNQGSAYIFVPCRYDLSPASLNFPVGGGNSSFTVNCGSNCAWTAAALPSWISITSANSGTGNGTITFTVAANPGLPRTSSISVSGSSFDVTQSGSCALTLSPTGLPGGIIGTAYNQTLTASGGVAPYNFQLNNSTTLPPGLSLSTGGVISGTPTVGSAGNYTFIVAAVDTNGCVGSRTHTLNIATCAVTSLSPTSQSAPGAGGSFTFTVTAAGCAWTTLSHASWLTVTSNASGTGNLVVGYSVGANPGPARTGVITVNNQTFTVNEAIGDPNGDVDNDGIPNGVELIEGTNPEVKDNDIFINTPKSWRLFVMQQYRDFLGREGDVAGIQGWVDLLTNGTLTRAQVIQSFFNSPEFQQFGAPIVRLYLAYFLRIPDYAGQLGWTSVLRGGTSLDTISQQFALSPEFVLTYGSLNNTQFITLVYQNVLNRTPSQAEVDAWVALLNQGAPRGQVMAGFSESPEFKQQSANKVFVVMMYVGMLRREPEQAGFDGWLALLNGGTSQLVMTQSFLDAPEYHIRFLP